MKKEFLVTKDSSNKYELIVEDAGDSIGYYLYVIDLLNNVCVKDFLCDTLEEAFLIAKEEYKVNKENFLTASKREWAT